MSDAHTGDLIEELEDGAADEVDRSKMSFLEHLEELRKRIIYSLYAVLACLSVTFWFMDTMNNFMLRYFKVTAAGGEVNLLATELTEAVKFLVSFNNEYLTIMPALAIIFSMYVKVVLGLGLVFELPMLVFFLARFGIVSAGFMIRKTKYAILFIFVLAAIITPSADIASQLVFAGPMMVLYAISIGVAWLFGKKKPKAEAA
jgi:Sec-independent protein secretion pathway component TatC